MFQLRKKEKLKDGRIKYVLEFSRDINEVNDVINFILNLKDIIHINIHGTINVGNAAIFDYNDGKLIGSISMDLSRRNVVAGIVEGDPKTGIWKWTLGIV